MTSRASAVAITCLLGAVANKARRRNRPEVSLGEPQRSEGITMTATHHDPHNPSNNSDDEAVEAANESIRLEILRQLKSINCDDDNWRIEPLPSFEGDGSTRASSR